MEEETEALDWGQEEDERQEALRMTAFDQNSRRDFSDGDDVEDTVSLGEDEDEPIYYNQHQHATRDTYNTGPAAEVSERPPSSQRRADNMGANDQRGHQHNSREVEPLESSASRDSRLSTDSPPRQRYSARHSTPQRSQQNGVRITHALPPKPAVAQVLYLPPSHPSMVEAVGMASTSISPPNRTAIRDPKKINGTPGKPGSSPMPADLPQDWEKRFSRDGGQIYYHNLETAETTWDFPVSNLPSTSTYWGSQRRRRRSASPGNMHIIPPDSNTHHSQTSRSKRTSSQSRHENNLEDAPRPLTPDLRGLSYEDRHYRPGGDAPPIATEIPSPERNEGVTIRPGTRARYDRSPGMSPPRQRRRARSISPVPDSRGPRVVPKENDYLSLRGNARSARDRNVYTNPDSTIPRNLDPTSVESEYSDRRWIRSPHLPPSDFSRNERGSRRPPHRPNDEDDFMLEPRTSDNRNRQPLRRRDSSRGPRDREQPRPSERREKPSETQSFISAPTGYRSPPRTRERDLGRDYGPPLEAGSYSTPTSQLHRERDRPRFNQPNSSGPPLPARPPPRDSFNGRSHDHEPPPSRFEQPRHREERDVERNRRDPLPSDNGSNRPPNAHSEESNRMSNKRPQRFANDYKQVSPEEPSLLNRRTPLPPQNKTFYSSIVPGHRRDPVPYAPGWANGDPTLPKEPRYAPNDPTRNEGTNISKPPQDHSQTNHSTVVQRPPPIDTRMDIDYNKPQNPSDYASPYDKSRPLDTPREFSEPSRSRSDRPRPPLRHASSNSARPIPSPNTSNIGPDSARHGPASGLPPQTSFGDRHDQDSPQDARPRWKDSRVGNMYPERDPPPQPRHENQGRPDDAARPSPPGPVSGTNNVPIGLRRPQAPLPGPIHNNGPIIPPYGTLPPTFNPSARPPPSTLINPTKAHELPPGKESYERPSHLATSYGPGRSDINIEAPRRDKPPHTVEVPHKPPVELGATEKPKRRRESRFSPIETRTKSDQSAHFPQDGQRGRGHSPDNRTTTHQTVTEKLSRQATPPPLSREPSGMSVTTEQASSRLSDRGPISDTDVSRSGTSRGPSTFSDANEPLSHNVPVRGEITPPLSSVQTPSSEQSFKPTQQRGLNKWAADARQVSEQQSSVFPQITQPVSPPTLARRMSSEKPPRLRKYPSASANISVTDNEFRGANSGTDHHSSSNSGTHLSDDLKDRLDRPTLLDRLQAPAPETENLPSLRERLVPSKRDRDDVDDGHSRDISYDNEDGIDSKRARRRTGRGKRGGGRRTMS